MGFTLVCGNLGHAWFLIRMSNMDLWSQLCSARWLASFLHYKNLNFGHDVQIFRSDFFHTCHGYELPFYFTVSDDDLRWRSQGQLRAKHFSFISHILFNWLEWHLWLCWSNSSWTIWYYWARFVEKREIAGVLLTASNKFKVGILSDVCELISIRLCIMIDTVEFCILILVLVTFTFSV